MTPVTIDKYVMSSMYGEAVTKTKVDTLANLDKEPGKTFPAYFNMSKILKLKGKAGIGIRQQHYYRW